MCRNTLRLVSTLSLLALLPLLVRSAPPSVTAITPRGAERGQEVEIVVAGKDLTPKTRLLLPFPAVVELLPDAKPNPAQVRFKVKVDTSVAAGLYPIHVVTEDGLSALQWFVVDTLPQISEVEPNQPQDKAQAVPFGVTVTGQCLGGDVDFFRFPLKKGQRVVLETESARLGSGVLPQLRLTDAGGRFLAADDAQKLRGDGRLVYTAPEAGDYVVEIADSRYKGAAPAHYRLRIADYDIVEEVFPLGGQRGEAVEFTLYGSTLAQPVKVSRKLDEVGSIALVLDGMKAGGLAPEVVVGDWPERVITGSEAVDVTLPVVVNGRLEQKGQSQRVRFPVQPGQKLRLAVAAESLGSYLDGVLRITDPAGKQLALVDDVNVALGGAGQPPAIFADPATEITVPAGVTQLIAEVRDQRGRGGINFGYRLTLEPITDDFELRLPVSELNVAKDGSTELIVPVQRRGYNGPLQLVIPNLPPGLVVHGGQVPADGTAGALTLTSQVDPADPIRLRVEGVATIDGKEVRRPARQLLIVSKEASPAAALRWLPSFTVGLTGPEPFAVQGPQLIEAVKGYPTTVTVTVTRQPEVKAGPVEVSGGVPPYLPLGGKAPANAAFTVQAGSAAVESGSFILTPKANAPEGVVALLVQGKSKIAAKDVAVVGPAVALTIKPPFLIEPPPALELQAGQIATLKGKFQRQPVFKETLQWKVDGLPKGVTLVKPPAPLAADALEYQVELKADPKLVPAKANLSLTFSTTIGGAPYNHAPVVVPLELK